MDELDELNLRMADARAKLHEAQANYDKAVTRYLHALRAVAPACAKPTSAPLFGRRWTPDDDADLLLRWSKAPDVKSIAAALGRTVGAIVSRLAKLGVEVQVGDERATC